VAKKLTKHGNSLALIIDKPLLELLKINEQTQLELLIEDGMLVVKPLIKKKKSNKSNIDIDKIAERIMKKYDTVFKKLAKT
jgi:antitoxin MazE